MPDSPKKRQLKKLGQPKAKPKKKVVEKVPDWLAMLLAKYGETQGLLVGLEEETVLDVSAAPVAQLPEPEEGDDVDLAALFDQMAEQGPSLAEGHTATSVEWGAYDPRAADEPPPPPIDDLLAEMGASQEDLYQDRSPQYDPSPPAAAAQPYEQQDVPDWISGIVPGAADTGAAESDPSSAAEATASDDEIPDWLDEIAPPTPESKPAPVEQAQDIPDWLNEAAPTPPPVSAAPSQPEVNEADVPDWLSEALQQPVAPKPAASPSPFETTTPASTDDEAEIPDWLSENLGQSIPADEPAAVTAAGATESDEAVHVPDWLLESLEPSAGPEASPSTLGTEPPSDTQAEADIPDWLSEMPAETADPPAGMPDWSGDMPASEITPLQTDEEALGSDIPDWLSEMGTPQVDEVETALPNEPYLTGTDPAGTGYPDMPAWLTGEPTGLEDTPLQDIPSEAGEPTAADVPDWLSASASDEVLDASTSEDETAFPDWLIETEQADIDSVETEEEIPDWLHASAETPAEVDDPDQVGEEPPVWLLDAVQESSTEENPPDWLDGLEMPEASPPDWLQESETAEEEPATGVQETPSWLEDFQADTADLAAPAFDEGESPPVHLDPTPSDPEDWLADLDTPSSAEITETAGETIPPPGTGWLRDFDAPPAAGTDEPTAGEVIPPPGTGWLRDFDDLPSSETGDPTTEAAIPPPGTGWLRDFDDLSSSEAEETTDEPSPLAEPDWLEDLSQPEESRASSAELPAYLSEAEESPQKEARPPAQVPDSDSAARQASGLKRLKPLKRPSGKPASPALPDWVKGLLSTDKDRGQTAPAPPDWATNLTPPAAAAITESVTPAAPGWIQALIPAGFEIKPEPPAAIEPPESAPQRPLRRLSQKPVPSAQISPEPVPVAEPEEAKDIDAAEFFDEAPDWLSDQAVAEQTSPAEAAAPTDWIAQFADTSAPDLPQESLEVEDWSFETSAEDDDELAQRLDLFTGADPAKPSEAPVDKAESPFEDQPDIPDWLTDESAGISTEADLTEPDAEGADIPDWLADLSEPGPTTETPAPPSDEDDFEIPGWLTEEPPPASAAEESSPQPVTDAAETMDWLAGLSKPATTDEDVSEVPDWLAEDLTTGIDETEETLSRPITDEAETLDWLAELPEPAATTEEATGPTDEEGSGIPDWLMEESPEMTAGEEPEIPGWPAEDTAEAGEAEKIPATSGTGQQEEALPPPVDFPDFDPEEDELDLPTWLAASAEVIPDEDSAVDQDKSDLLDWPGDDLQDIELTTDTPDWSADLPDPFDAEEELALPAWLADSVETEAVEDMPAGEDKADLSGWSTDMPETIEVETDTPDWSTELSDTSFNEEELELPTWLADTVEVEPEEDRQVSQEAPEIPGWLAGVTGITQTEEAQADKPAASVGTDEIAEETDADTPGWLADLPPAPDTGELSEPAPTETPDWLADLPEAPATGPLSALPEWDEEAEAELDLETPAWLSSAETPEASSEPLAQDSPEETDADTPGWLADLPPAPDTGELGEPAPTGTPDWLADLPEAPATGQLSTPAQPAAGAEEEAELPPWLTDLARHAEISTTPAKPDAGEKSEPSQVADASVEEDVTENLDTSQWLTNLRTGFQIEEDEAQIPTESLADDPEAPVPDWLAEIAETVETDEDEEITIPDWLTDTAESVDVEPVDDEDIEPPAWLTETPDTAEEAEVVEPPADTTLEQAPEPFDALAETPELSLADEAPADDIEPPAWLTDTLETDEAEEEETAPAAAEQDDEIEIPAWLGQVDALTEPEAEVKGIEPPDWLADLPDDDQAVEADLEPPAWLTETVEAEDVEEDEIPEPVVEEGSEPLAETPEILDALAETPELSLVDEAPADDIEPPAWLTDTLETDEAEEEAAPAEIEQDDEVDTPAWLTEIPNVEDEETAGTEDIEEALEIPAWLGQISDQVETSAASDSTEVIEEKELELPDWFDEPAEAAAATAEMAAEPVLEDEALELPDWAANLPDTIAEEKSPAGEAEVEDEDEEIPMPGWLTETPTRDEDEDQAAAVSAESPQRRGLLAGLNAATEALEASLSEKDSEAGDVTAAPEQEGAEESAESLAFEAQFEGEELTLPDWLKDPPASDESTLVSTRPQPLGDIQPKGTQPASPPAASKSWLDALKPGEQSLTEDEDDSKVAESTGVLAGLTGLLPAEKVVAPTTMTDLGPSPTGNRQDAILQAARAFQAIATQVPQPATLPAPLTGRARLMGNALRGLLYLLFIALIALPLVPSLQRQDGSNGDQRVPWTEPGGSFSDVLDRQRRELISNELGIVDLQQPGTVALVSIDYTAATQGEMEPLARAVISRLRGQDMRIIFISLEPEGAALAQKVLDYILTERDETYGDEMVNLGYLPGRVATIRGLASGQLPLASLADYQDGLTLTHPDRAAWNGIENLRQVDVVVNISDNPTTSRWWIEQMELAPPSLSGERYLLAATSATVEPFLRPYRDTGQLDGLISGINGAAAIEASRRTFGAARQMLDSQSMAHLIIVILIAVGTIAGWMPPLETMSAFSSKEKTGETEIPDMPQPDEV